jgi:hypothetical protein
MKSWWMHTAAVVGGAVLFMAVAAWASRPWWEYAFLSDDSPVSWLSSALLMANAAVAGKLTVDGSLRRWIGSSLAIVLVVLALDEQFMLHERFKYTYTSAGTTSIHPGTLPRAVGDLSTVLVGLGGIGFGLLFAREVSSKPARGLMGVAVAIGLFSLWVDLGDPPVWLARIEEGYEVLAESIFLAGLLAVPRHVQSSL